MRVPLRSLLALALAPSLAAAPAAISLAGTWRFALDPAGAVTRADTPAPAVLPEGDGLREGWYAKDLAGSITLPGILQAQGYGDEIRPDTPWLLTLGDAWWKLQPAELRERFSKPGQVRVPFLSQPPRHYLGPAWYQRDVEVPQSWKGLRAQLYLERPHWETTVWWDGQAFAPDRGLMVPHTTELGLVAPGHHRLTIRIDNRQLLTDPAGNNHMPDSHSVSDALGAAWNGIAGAIELRPTTPVWIEDAQAYPDVAQHSVLVRVTIGNLSGRPGRGTFTAGPVSVPARWSGEGGYVEAEVPLGTSAQPWDEFHPVLQHLSLRLVGDDADDLRPLAFGLREIGARDRDLRLNGQPVNLRLTHFGGDFPLTGYPPTDVESWRRIIATCKAYGLNGIRFHSWSPPEAAFQAADELGFYLQPECGLWAPLSPGNAFARFLEEETARLVQAFGNHPSFLLLSPSNEPSGHYPQVTPAWAAEWHARDGRRLYSAGTGWADPSQVFGGAQYASLVRFNGGELRNVSGWFGGDYRKAVETAHLPILSHEVGQWCAYPDFDVMKEFTGYLQPGNYEIFKYLAEQNGVLDQDHAFAYASGRFQLACYKEEFEANLRTPGLAGITILDLHDYLGQGTALIGVTDAFWRPKSYVTAAEFRRFAGPTVPLVRLSRRTFTSEETLRCDAELYHFGEAPLLRARPYWRIVDAQGKPVAGGEWPERTLPIGKNLPLGSIEAPLSSLLSPAAYHLVVGLAGTPIQNDWPFWVYPAAEREAAPPDFLATSDWAAASATLAAGGRVLFTPADGSLDPVRCPLMKQVPIFWNIQMTVRPPRNPTPRQDAMLGLLCDPSNPALAGFPTTTACDWQWTPVIDNVRSINLAAAPRDLVPIVSAIDDWNRNWRLGVIFECRVGPGSLLVCAADLGRPHPGLEVRALRRSLYDYVGSRAFSPKVQVGPAVATSLFVQAPAPLPATHRTFDPDLDDGTKPTR